jgi:hypothetical protein
MSTASKLTHKQRRVKFLIVLLETMSLKKAQAASGMGPKARQQLIHTLRKTGSPRTTPPRVARTRA